MKFSCERCGKKYATAETPAPGRVYKLKCKACGHLIVVKASSSLAGAAPAQPAVGSEAAAPPEAAAAPPLPAQPPEVELEIGVPEPSALGSAAFAGASPVLDATTEVSVAATSRAAFPPGGDIGLPQGDAGYVDLFGDGAPSEEQKPSEDPFLAAARASLPDGYGSAGGAPDPFAPLREELSRPAAEAPPAPPTPKVPVIPKPPQQRSGLPIVLIGGGVAVLIGILAFVVMSSGGKAPAPPPGAAPASAQLAAQAPVQAAPPPPPPVAQPAQEPPPQAEPAPPPPPVEAKAAPAPPPKRVDEDRRARDERRRREREEAQARAEQARAEKERREREAREARDRERAERAERERAARERERQERERVAAASASEEPEGGLTQAQIEGVLRSTKKAFDGCIQAARGTDVKLDGRRVMLRLNIQTSGAVTYPTLDDVTLNGTELGSCLKSAARLMVFPKFKGDTMHVEVPLVMR